MKVKAGTIILSVVVLLLFFGIIGGMTTWSHRNTMVSLEEQVAAQYKANQNSYDNMWKKFMELTQVTEIQANQMKDVYTGLIAGRYQDPNVLFKMVKEDNPKLDQGVYTQLQRQIEAGRNEFKNDQNKLLDVIREYNTKSRQWIVTAAITGAQRIDEDKYIITSDKTQNAFDSKKDDVINLNGTKK